MFTLAGRTAVFTGATGYQGLGIVHALLDGGMNVAMITHMPDRLQGIYDSLSEEQRTRCVGISNADGDAAAMQLAKERFGSVDVIIPMHGPGPREDGIETADSEELAKRFNMNVIHTLEMIRAGVPYLKASKAGRIILFSTAGARYGLKEEGLTDSVIKGSVISMTYSLAQELAPYGITVNCIAKTGLKDTPMLTKPERGRPPVLGAPADSPLLPAIPVGHSGTPEELGALAAWLASEEAAFVTGEVINFCGGIRMG